MDDDQSNPVPQDPAMPTDAPADPPTDDPMPAEGGEMGEDKPAEGGDA